MKVFDPHIHMNSRTTDDYMAMAAEGIVAVCEPAFWQGQPRTHVGSYEDYLKTITGWEHFRASQFGVHHFCTIALNPKEANNAEIAPGVMELLPKYVHKENVIGIGEIGFDDMTDAEEKYFRMQLEMAIQYHLPVLVHTPHRNKKEGTQETINLIKSTGIEESMVLIDHNNEETLPLVLEQTRCWAGHSIYPQTKMSKRRMMKLVQTYGIQRIIINSAADWGVSDPLNTVKTMALLRENEVLSERELQTLFWHNPMDFFKQSKNLTLEHVLEDQEIDQRKLWEGNSVLRGQEPVVQRKGT